MARAWTGCVLLSLIFLLLVTSIVAEITPREAQRFCVDIVLLKGGTELRGSVLKRDAQQTRIAVQRDWLNTHQPAMAKLAAEEEIQQQEKNRADLKDRIDVWRKERADQQRLTFMLDKELAKLSKPLEKDAPSQFVIIDLPADRIRRIFETPAASRPLAAAAWFERIEKVEETVFGKLKTQVEQTHPKWATERIDISDRLPRGQPQSDDEWAARQALWEYEFCEELNYQGTGSFVVRVEPGKKPDLSALMSQSGESLLAGPLSGLGLDLGGGKPQMPAPDAWQKKAIDEARDLNIRGFLVTRSPQITGEGPAIVVAQFFARLGDGNYRVVWSDEVRTDPSTIPEDDLKRIQQDPQIQEVLKVAQALSLGNEVQKAVRFGGAVEVSMKSVTGHFAEFRSRYNRTLDGPPLTLPTANP